jgi:hypothetical protein
MVLSGGMGDVSALMCVLREVNLASAFLTCSATVDFIMELVYLSYVLEKF